MKDTAGHSESRGEPVTVSESPLLITAVPEGGSLVPGLENRVYILTSYPDGTPAESDVRVRGCGKCGSELRLPTKAESRSSHCPATPRTSA